MFKKITSHFRQSMNQKGFSMLEVLIAVLISAIMVVSLFQFFTRVSTQTEGQYQLSEAQHRCRSSLTEIKKNLRMAGYKVGAHSDYEINGDTLSIYMSVTQPVDTIKYYLVEFNDAEYANVDALPHGQKLFNLVKQTNSDAPTIYSDFITAIAYSVPDSQSVEIQVDLLTAHSDMNLDENDGFRDFSLTERVRIRNAS